MRASLLLAVVAGCAGVEANPLPPAAPSPALASSFGYFPGETMAYEVQLAGVLVGEAQLAVGEVGVVDGHRAIVVTSRAQTAGAAALLKHIVDESTTTIDVESGRPLAVDSRVINGAKQITASARFLGPIANITYQRNGASPHRFKIAFKTEALHDMHSAMAQLRGWRAPRGATRTVYIVGGRRLWRIDVRYVGEDTIGSPTGNRRAVVLEGTSYRARRDLKVVSSKPARTFRVWLSDDADRVPIKCTAKTELGDIVMDLVEYARP